MSFCIEVFCRTSLSKKATNQERHKGNIPAVLYFAGKSEGMQSIAVNGKEFNKFINSIEKNSLGVSVFLVSFQGEELKVLVKGIQYGLVTYPVDIKHLDLMVVEDSSVVTIKVPVKLKNYLSGECIGLQSGGAVRQNLRRLAVSGKLQDIPKSFYADMKNCRIGDSVYVRDVIGGAKVKMSGTPLHEALATVDKKKGGN